MLSPVPTFFPVRPADAAVRPLPFPFRGALAISNDAEFLQWDFFEALMRFLNTRTETPFGTGLGMRMTTSVFFYTVPAYNFSYFDGSDVGSPRSTYADRLDQYIRAGLIDTIHAYGDFDGSGGCTRAHATAALRAIESAGGRMEVFSNHGSIDNVQNVGADAAYHCGDRPGHPSYHADLLAAHGVKYVWTDSLVTPPGDGSDWRAVLRRLGRSPPKILAPVILNDGQELHGFRRFRGTGANAPNLSSLHTQIEQIPWREMYASWGATFIYQHLGVLQREAGVCEAATIERVKARPELYLAPFHRLHREHQEGRLWVCGCAELLRHLEMSQTVRVHHSAEAAEIALDFPGEVADPSLFFAGLTIKADPRRNMTVTFRGRALPVAWNGPEGSDGEYSLTVMRPPMADIW